MSLKNFLYYILKPDGRSATVTNGVVSYSGTPHHLPETPDGWQDIVLAWERTERHGLSSNFSLPLSFVRSASQIIRDCIYKETVEAELLLLIQRLTIQITNDTYNWFYKYFHRIELNLEECEDGEDSVNVPMEEGGVVKQMKAAKDTDFEFPMTNPLCVNLKLDGILKNYNKKFTIQENQETYGPELYYLGMFGVSSEGVSKNVNFFDIIFKNSSPYPNLDYFTEVKEFAQQIIITGFIDIYYNRHTGVILRVETNDGGTGGLPQYDILTNANSNRLAGVTERYPINLTIAVPTNTRLNMKLADTTIGGGADVEITVLGGELNVEYDYREATTFCKAYKRFDLGNELVTKITGRNDIFTSQLCKDFNALVITCGDAIRQFEAAKIKTNFGDYDKDTDSTLMSGLYISKDIVEIENREKYYSEDDVYHLGVVKDFKMVPAKDYMYNTYRFGNLNNKQLIDDVNGRYDPNGTNVYNGPRGKKKEYAMASPYKASPYEIENIRTNLNGKKTTDDTGDNDVFVIAAIATGIKSLEVSFVAADSTMIISAADRDYFIVNQQIRIVGTASNDGVYDITSIDHYLSGYKITFSQTTVDESTVTTSIEWLSGELYTLDRPDYDVLEGVPNETIFNLPLLTPKTKFFRHKRWIKSSNDGLGNKQITFANGKDNKNTELKTELAGVIIDEDAPETIDDLGDLMYKPWVFIFKGETFVEIPEIIEDNPNKAFSFEDEYGQLWTGFNLINGIAINEFTPQEFRLLCAPSNDVKRRIHG